MSEDFSALASELRTHASNVAGLGDTLSDVEGGSEHIASNEAYGLLCSWLPPILEGRHTGFDNALTVLKENMQLLSDALSDSADDFENEDQANAESLWTAGES